MQHWLECREKSCCSSLLVLVTGDDVARIARRLGVAPWEFTLPVDASPEDAMGFALDRTDRRYRLALARVRLDDAPAACTFLIRAKGGAARCGLGELRPAPCRSYPAQIVDGAIAFAIDRCTCDWSQIGARDGSSDDLALLRAEERARAIEARLAEAWNAFVLTLEPSSLPLAHRDYCRHLLDRYGSDAT